MSIEQRIERLERSNGRLRLFAGATCAMLVALVLCGQSPTGVPKVIQTHALHIVADDGRVLMKLEGKRNVDRVWEDPELAKDAKLRDEVLAITAKLPDPELGRIAVLDAHGRDAVEIRSVPLGGRITTSNAAGNPVIELGSDEVSGKEGLITVKNEQGEPAVVARSIFGWGSVRTESGDRVKYVAIDANSGIALRGQREDGTNGGILSLTARDSGAIESFDPEGKPVFRLRMNANGEAYIALYDAARRASGNAWMVKPAMEPK